MGSVAVIRSKAGSERSNHWHRTDCHYLYTASGRWLYQEGDPDAGRIATVDPVEVKKGQMVFTPSGRAHRCVFLEDTVLISISKLTRTHENHEADVVRLEQ